MSGLNSINLKYPYYFHVLHRSVFPQIDTNGNGRISVQELASRTDRSMKAFYKQEADTRMKALDTNKDGKVTWEEYTTGAENRRGNINPVVRIGQGSSGMLLTKKITCWPVTVALFEISEVLHRLDI